MSILYYICLHLNLQYLLIMQLNYVLIVTDTITFFFLSANVIKLTLNLLNANYLRIIKI